TGMNLLPLCTASVCPTKSGVMVEARAHVLMTFFSPRAFMSRIFASSFGSTYGPFFNERDMLYAPPVALPRRRPRTISLLDAFFLRRVFTPSGLPQGET